MPADYKDTTPPVETDETTKPSPPSTDLGDAGIRAMQGTDESPESIEAQFQEKMSELPSHEKGAWGERVVTAEAKAKDHTILLSHPDKPTAGGFDCVSFDEQADRLHIWEAKNFSGGTVTEDHLKAWRTERGRDNWGDILDALRGSPLEPRVKQAVNEDRVSFHLRVGPETRISSPLREQLDQTSFPWCDFDWRQYSVEEMEANQSEPTDPSAASHAKPPAEHRPKVALNEKGNAGRAETGAEKEEKRYYGGGPERRG